MMRTMTREDALQDTFETRVRDARRMLNRAKKDAPAILLITCGNCGNTDDAEAWTHLEVFGRLPSGEFQCPGCGFAFKRVSEPWTRTNTGYWNPGKVKLVGIETRM